MLNQFLAGPKSSHCLSVTYLNRYARMETTCLKLHFGKLIGSIDHANQVGANVKLRLLTRFGLFCSSNGFCQRVINDGCPIENTYIIHDFIY